jgi:UV DNA damage endonuclease
MNLGYACINLSLSGEGVTTNKGMIRKTFLEKGVQYASQLALQNVQALLRIVQWNVARGIRVFRITSDLFPWASEYRLEEMPEYTEIRSILEEVGRQPVRLSTHPGPFNKLAGEGATLANTIKDLELHSQLFDLMQLTPSHWNKINIHVGGAYGDKGSTIQRFGKNFRLLSSHLQKRLTVENDDKPGLYTVAELEPLHQMIGIPIVFDYFHHRLHNGGLTEEEAFLRAYHTWDVKPVFHYSSSRKEYEDPTCKKEAHSDWMHEKINTYGKDVDIVLETKMKELSLIHYLRQFEGQDVQVWASEIPLLEKMLQHPEALVPACSSPAESELSIIKNVKTKRA